MDTRHAPLLSRLREAAQVLGESPRDYYSLLEMSQGRDLVLLGEATHGTAEFYAMRAQISQRLIAEAGFDAVAVEADWPDAWRLNRYVQGGNEASLDSAFDDFQRFPTWMWRNHDVRRFIASLRQHNEYHPLRQAGFYGLDLYSLYRSAEAVGSYLDRVDPDQAERARRLYAALDHARDAQEYGLEATRGLRAPCRDAAIALLVDLTRKAGAYLAHDGRSARDEYFFAERNAHVVVNAERYYRTMSGGRSNSWNLRDGAHGQPRAAGIPRNTRYLSLRRLNRGEAHVHRRQPANRVHPAAGTASASHSHAGRGISQPPQHALIAC